MRICCHRCSSDIETRERIWSLIESRGGFISDYHYYILFYIPESVLSFALLIDSTLVPVRMNDYIA